jgi:spoIIIJ-associated protein
MKTIIVSAKSVEEAIQDGLNQLNTTEDQVDVVVLEQSSKGLFGLLGGKDAKVQLTLKEVARATSNSKAKSHSNGEVFEQAKAFLAETLATMGLDVTIVVLEQADQVVFDIQGKDLSQIIGRRGQTLDALQYLTNLVANRYSSSHARIVLDAENYRARRRKTLEQLAQRLASSVVKSREDVVLEPMSPAERKIIHAYLQEHPKVTTFSKGEEPNRRIVITLR